MTLKPSKRVLSLTSLAENGPYSSLLDSFHSYSFSDVGEKRQRSRATFKVGCEGDKCPLCMRVHSQVKKGSDSQSESSDEDK
ncbi:hypothetical protein CcaverHIS002_0504010 [Cutaneotrichosporon cavernicola]|uniref:Uncharacterized protein n=1 Tax=Cutaneotrichosporon cavernicola TaxID=279322 RepID=A0AA48L6G6_9TREE|nr:uncharacterized protein CcaverHIS019_0504560 [Cutaneotrichosporon cavernicola]BEI85000.1 hypothetical protein CcaverHIS002_0504010 [Cutaneotrichosporon cavernicola]BEI92828.1 hypothetical protein CcaverHIS019_0504560 [Cutaneotrichosporon cavernicola]BEJ00604.1 hypothetical protein CcaverHIS631_0504610 [Cutaneotrichosporon cavernicola]